MKKLLILGLVLVSACGVLGVFGFANAQEPEERITLSPAVARPELDAGDVAEGKLTIINDGTVPYTFLLYARPFSVDNESYDPNYTEVNERTEAYQWIQFNQTKLTLQPSERVRVGYTITVPEDTAGGGYYAVLFAETQPPESDGSSVARKKRVGSLLYMTVSGDVIRKGELASWDVNTLQTNPPVQSDVRITNTGNVHFQAAVKVQYNNLFGKKQFEQTQDVLILPDTTRNVPITWERPPYFGIFKASGETSFLGNNETLEEKWIILFPRSLMVILASILVVALLWAFAGKPAVKKRRLKKSK